MLLLLPPDVASPLACAKYINTTSDRRAVEALQRGCWTLGNELLRTQQKAARAHDFLEAMQQSALAALAAEAKRRKKREKRAARCRRGRRRRLDAGRRARLGRRQRQWRAGGARPAGAASDRRRGAGGAERARVSRAAARPARLPRRAPAARAAQAVVAVGARAAEAARARSCWPRRPLGRRSGRLAARRGARRARAAVCAVGHRRRRARGADEARLRELGVKVGLQGAAPPAVRAERRLRGRRARRRLRVVGRAGGLVARRHGAGRWRGHFQRHAVDGSALLSLDDVDVQEIGVAQLGARKAIVRRLKSLRRDDG